MSKPVKKKSTKQKRNTEKMKKLVKLISVNLGIARPKSMYEMMIEAGYSEKTARQQSAILMRIKEDLKPLTNRLEEERDAILMEMVLKRPLAKYSELSASLDRISKNIQLLSNKPTDIVKTEYGELTDEQLQNEIKRRENPISQNA